MKQRLETSLLLAAIGGLYVCTASSGAILDDGDALYAGVARQMIERDDWVTPYVNGVRFLDKPPLMYWMMALSFKMFGFTELAARLPTILAVAGTALILYLLVRNASGVLGGSAGALAMSLAPGTFLFTRMVFPDMLFVFMLTLALYGFFAWYAGGGSGAGPALLFYAATAGAVLSKGLIGLIFPAAIALLFLALQHQTSWLRSFHVWKGCALFLLLALPWHILSGVRTPGFFWFFFVNEHLLRFLGKRQPLDYETIRLFPFWALVAVWLFPWTAFFPAAVRMYRDRGALPCSRRQLLWFSLSWIVVVFAFFSFSSRIEHYALPVFPPLALIVGLALASDVDSPAQRWVNRGFQALGIAGGVLLLMAVGAVCLPESLPGPPGPHTRAYSYYFAPLFDLPGDVRLRLQLPLVVVATGLSLGLITAWLSNRSGRRRAAVGALAIAMAVFCGAAWYSLKVCEEVLSSRQFAGALNASWRPGDRLVIAGDYETANSLNFYTSAHIQVCDGRAAVLEWGLKYPDAPRVILSEDELERYWAGPDTVFLLGPDRALANLALGPSFPLRSSAGRTLLCNHPTRGIRGF